MGVHLNETELADLEPQIFKIFKKELGFFDNDILSTTMATINRCSGRMFCYSSAWSCVQLTVHSGQ